MIGLDTSVLVAHAIVGHPLHCEVQKWVASRLAEGRTFAVTSGILAEFVHVVTDSRRFEHPLTISEAVAWARFWSEAEEAILVASDENCNRQWLNWLQDFQIGRKRLLDTLLAATFHSAGVKEVCTLNPNDFRVFNVFLIHHLQ